MPKKFLAVIFLICFSFSFFPQAIRAAGLVPCGGTGEPACELCHLLVLFKNIVEFVLFRIVPILATIMIVVAGFMYIFAYLSPTQGLPGGKGGPVLLGQAKRLLSSVVIGIIIMFGAWIIVNSFFQVIGVAEWTGLKDWWQIKGCP